MIVDVYDCIADIFGDGQYVDHMRFEFDDCTKALDFVDEVVNEHGKVVVVSAKGINNV